jgi:hypothetical protein
MLYVYLLKGALPLPLIKRTARIRNEHQLWLLQSLLKVVEGAKR